MFEKQSFIMDSHRYYIGLKYSVLAAIIISLIWFVFIVLKGLPDFNSYIFVFLIAAPTITALISLVSTIIFIIPSVILLKRINLDKKIPVVIIGSIVGLLLWYLSTVELGVLPIVLIYSVTCSYAFMVGYDKYKKDNEI